jgi:DNA-binding transcriptional LysR family regulator
VLVRVAEPEDGRELLRIVRDGRAELGLSDLAAVGPGMVTHPLARQELFAVCPPATTLPTRSRRGVPVAWLAERPLVTTRPGTSTRDLLDTALGRAGAIATIAVETGQREAIVPLVLAGAGCALLPEPVARRAAEQGAVVARVDPGLERTIGIVHRDEPLSPAATAFLEVATAR